MQQAFCTNCGKPLTPGAAFCPSCGARAEAPAAVPGAMQTGQAGYMPGSSSPATFSPQQPNAPAAAPRSQTGKIIGGLIGCLALFLLVVLALIGALVYGILKQQSVFFFIGLVGLGLIILVGVGIEHLIRRLYHRARGGIQAMERPGFGYTGQRTQYQQHRQQHRFHPIRFLITLVLIAAALYGGLFLYYSQQFSGDWQGVLSVGGVQQGLLLTNLHISLSFQRPANLSTSDPGAIELTQVNFTQETAQACNKKGSQARSYQFTGSTSRLDASQVSVTLTSSQTSLPLQGTYQAGKFMLNGTSQGKPVTLTLQKGGQSDFSATCKQLT